MHRSYPVMTLAFVCLGIACIVVFCRMVNPYALYNEVSWVNERRPADFFKYLRLHKPYAIERVSPDHLILGSSRASRIDPQLLQTILGGRAYNAALPGANLMEMRRAAEHAQAINPLKSAIIVLDNQMFLGGRSKHMDYFVDARWRQPQPSLLSGLLYSYQKFEDYWRSLLSVDALVDSWRALSLQEPSDRVYEKDGSWYEKADAVDPTSLYTYFAVQTYKASDVQRNQLDLKELEKLLDFTQANGIDAKLLIAPMNGLLMHTKYLAHSWKQYLNWQRELVKLVSKRGAGVAIYGLEDNPQMVLETVNAPDPLFLDGMHITHKAGREITACIIAPCESSLRPTLLDAESIGPYLQRVEGLRRKYVEDNPQNVKKLRAWLRLDAP